MSEAPVLCFRCGGEIPANNLGRRDSCAACGADTRVCKNCTHFDPSRNNQCREEQAGRLVEKEKANFCDWFRPRVGPFGAAAAPSGAQARAAADALFGGSKPTAPTAADSSRAAAEALFKKKK